MSRYEEITKPTSDRIFLFEVEKMRTCRLKVSQFGTARAVDPRPALSVIGPVPLFLEGGLGQIHLLAVWVQQVGRPDV